MIWNTESMSWKQGKSIGTPPTTRYGQTSTAIGPHLLIFGGWEFSKAQNEIIVLREFNQAQQSQDQKDEFDDDDQLQVPGNQNETAKEMSAILEEK
mmetsp:Transcript_12080/g.13593  ORF Transcript_12080/g.13593 Transcript_12080/m.13593 type:complete len:96 (+) Transcript_12080:1023-1310(+)